MGMGHEEFVTRLAFDPVAASIHMSIAVCSVVVLVATGATLKHLGGWRLDGAIAVIAGVEIASEVKFESSKT